MSTRRIQLVVSYDGTDFRGWAAQAGQRTVQSTLTETVRQVSGEDCEIVGASRTDSGAHALGQVCHFDTTSPIEPGNWVKALNARLPKDLSVRESHEVPSLFHSRFWARHRHYRYRFILGQIADPMRARYGHHLHFGLDAVLMQQTAKQLVGEHDFRAFCVEVPEEAMTVRRLFRVEVRQTRDEVHLDVVGTAFLRGMMRRIAGLMLEVGKGKRPWQDAVALLDLSRRGEWKLSEVLPACGLCLMKVSYGRHPKDCRAEPNNQTVSDE